MWRIECEYGICWFDTKEIGMNGIFKRLSVSGAVMVMLSPVVLAQWSIGQKGTREPPQG